MNPVCRITLRDYDRWLDLIFRQGRAPERDGPRIDPVKLWEHGIPHSYDGELILLSASGMRKARKAGLVVDPEIAISE
jgi:hypothetical protein